MSSSFFSCFNASFVKLQSVREADCTVEGILLLMPYLVNSGSSSPLMGQNGPNTQYNILGRYVFTVGVTECLHKSVRE